MVVGAAAVSAAGVAATGASAGVGDLVLVGDGVGVLAGAAGGDPVGDSGDRHGPGIPSGIRTGMAQVTAGIVTRIMAPPITT